jgi:hypothetical protein
MSQYRDDRDAARRRIEALEARLADRDAELTRRGAALAERDEEIVRLQRELELAGGLGPRHMRSVSAAWASRIVGAATGLAIVAAGAGIILVRSSVSAVPPGETLDERAAAQAALAPIHADPLVGTPVDWAMDTPEATVPAATGGVAEIRRRLEPRVWGGRASQDEIRMLNAICTGESDQACRERSRMALERARAGEP